MFWKFTINNSVEFRMKSCTYIYIHNPPVWDYGSNFRCLPLCCILFSFLFVFIHFSCEKPASRLLPSFAFCCENDAKKTERQRERSKTKTAISPLHDEAVLSCCCCFGYLLLAQLICFGSAAASAKMKLIEFIIFYAFYMAPKLK